MTKEVTMKHLMIDQHKYAITTRKHRIIPAEHLAMKPQLRVASLLMVAVFGLALLAVPVSAGTLYDNGPINGNTDGWTINFGFTVSNNFTLAGNSTMTGFNFGVWYLPGDTPQTVDWSITSQENGGTVYGSGTSNLSNAFQSVNGFGYDIGEESVSGLNLNLSSGTY